MDPLTQLIVTSLVAAASTVASGAAQMAGSDLWNKIKTKFTRLAQLEKGRRVGAFNAAIEEAIKQLQQHYSDTAVERTLNILRQNTTFREMLLEEFLLSARPNIGRLLDYYRREIRFASLLRQQDLPAWSDIEPILRLFMGTLLPRTLQEQPALKQVLLDHEELQAIDDARALSRAAEASAASLERIESLLHSLVTLLPQVSDPASIAQITIYGRRYTVPMISPPELDTLFHRYQIFLSETYGMLDFRGIMQVQNIVRLPLQTVYVTLKGQLRGRQARAMSDTSIQGGKQSASAHKVAFDHQQIAPLDTVVRDAPFFVILGDPGAGKSTFVRHLMLALVQGQACHHFGLEEEWLPILFPVAAFAEARERQLDLSPLDYLSTHYIGLSQPDYASLFRRALLSGRALVLIDGLDEVRQDRLSVIRSLEAFVREWDVPGNRFVATSRIAGYDEAPLDDALFPRVILLAFDDDDIRAFISQWSTAFERAGTADHELDRKTAEAEIQRRAQQRAESLQVAVFANTSVTDLARNPLLLTILALIQNQGARLPDRRVELYRLCVEALAETWNRARSLSGREINIYLGGEKLDERFVVNLLGPAALWVHEENPGGLVEQSDLERKLAGTLVLTDGLPAGKAQRLAAEFIELVRLHTGLLQERGHRRYGFLHLTFEEYLAARALLESATVENSDALIHERCADPAWREVLRLALATVPQKEAQRLIFHLLEAPTTPETRGRPVVLAGLCLLDRGRSGATLKALQAVIDRLVALVSDAQVATPTRIEGGHVLGLLGDPRRLDPRQGDSATRMYWCQVDAGPFWYGGQGEAKRAKQRVTIGQAFRVARYPVTNAEYQHFIEHDGYNPDQPWWTESGRAFLRSKGKDSISFPRGWQTASYNNPSQPVTGVSWYEATAFCAWLTQFGHTQGWLPIDAEIHLPTSFEWERAARHTDKRYYPWGNTKPNIDVANYKDTGINVISPVGCFPRGDAVCSATDMVGNVAEWMETLGNEDLTRVQREAVTDEQTLLYHAGSYTGGQETLLCSARGEQFPHRRYPDLGFRLFWFQRPQ